MNKPTKEQIAAAIKKMEKIRPNVLPRTVFGDDNLAKFDAALRVLKEDIKEDDLERKLELDTTEEEFGERNQEVLSTAMQARRWMDGEEKESPAEGWPLRRK